MRYVAPTATIAGLDRITRSEGILRWINAQKPDDIGRYADWGGKEDKAALPRRDEPGPSILPRRIRAFGLLWIPAIVVLLTIESWFRVPQSAEWISLGVLFVVFNLIAFVPFRKRR
jgi:hypothetical protein